MRKTVILVTSLIVLLISNFYSDIASAGSYGGGYRARPYRAAKPYRVYPPTRSSTKLSTKQAMNKLAKGKSIMANSRTDAMSLARKTSHQQKPMKHQPHKNGYLPHVHPNGHVNANGQQTNTHIFYPK